MEVNQVSTKTLTEKITTLVNGLKTFFSNHGIQEKADFKMTFVHIYKTIYDLQKNYPSIKCLRKSRSAVWVSTRT
jgi:hypothetical protein